MELLLKHSSVGAVPEPAPPPPPAELPLKSAPPPPAVDPAPLKKDSLDFSIALHEHAKKVRASDLARLHEELEVVKMSDVLTLVQEAVDEAVRRSEREWNEKERKKLLEEAEEIFNERLESFKAEKAELSAQARHLKDQLARAQELLEEERQKVVRADQFTVSDAGLMELEKRLSRLLDHAILRGSATPELQAEMRAVVAKLLDDEREKISQKAKEAHSETISLLERKVHRLASSLEETQHAREEAEERARLLESAKGNLVLQNLYKAGLDEKDPKKEKKLALLKDIARGNREIRRHMARSGASPHGAPAGDPAAPPPLAEEREMEVEPKTDEIFTR